MRQSFLRQLATIASRDDRIMLLTADLGFMAVEVFADQFPDRFLNVGVAEQNMVAVATGLAHGGYIPFVYSIVPFAVLRPYEFIRNGPIHHHLPVRIVGVGGGFEYGHNGLTHYGVDDVGVMRIQPGITVVAPADRNQAAAALDATWSLDGPVYYRLGKDESKIVTGLNGRFDAGQIQRIGNGGDVLIAAMGSIATEAVRACELLRLAGVQASLAIVSTFTPAAADHFVSLLTAFPHVVTVEAHYVNGGLGSWVAELIAERTVAARLTRCGVREVPAGPTGNEQYMNGLYGISAEGITASALSALRIPAGTP